MSKYSIKAALLQVHSIIGLALALVLTLIGMTGATMSFEDEIGASLNAGIMRVEARATPMLTPDGLIARLQAVHDFGKVSAVTMASDPSAAVRIRFARNEGGSRPSSVYVDPYDARVLGSPRGEEFFATVRKLHRWLLLPGDANGYGRQLTGVVAIGLIVMLISGIVLRWPRRAGSVKIWLKPNLALRGRGFHWSLHSVVGTWVFVIYLVMALTGLWYSFDWYKNGAIWLLSRPSAVAAPMQPKMQPKSPRGTGTGTAATEARSLALDRAWSAFLHEQGSRFATAQLTLPAGAGTVVRVRSWARDAHEGARDEFRNRCRHRAAGFVGDLRGQINRRADPCECAGYSPRQHIWLAGPAAVHGRRSPDAAVHGHRPYAVSFAPKASAYVTADGREPGSGRMKRAAVQAYAERGGSIGNGGPNRGVGPEQTG